MDVEGYLHFSNVTRKDASQEFLYACSAASYFRNEYKLGNRVFLQVMYLPKYFYIKYFHLLKYLHLLKYFLLLKYFYMYKIYSCVLTEIFSRSSSLGLAPVCRTSTSP